MKQFLGETLIGPVIEVHIVEIHDSVGREIAIPSPNNPRRTSYGLISRGNGRFEDELYIPHVGHRVDITL